MMMHMTTTADRIRSLRRENGLTQEDLAARADCGLATIQRAEAGRPLSAASLASIAAAFDVPASALAADPEADFEPYLALCPIESGRALVALLLDAQRIDFAFCEIDSLADAEIVQALHDMCQEIAALETPLAPIHLVTRELRARDQLAELATAGFRVGGANYVITAHDVDDEGGGGLSILYGQWDERHAAIRVGRHPGEIARAHLLRSLGQYETVKGGALIEPPPRTSDIDWSDPFGLSPKIAEE